MIRFSLKGRQELELAGHTEDTIGDDYGGDGDDDDDGDGYIQEKGVGDE